VSSGADDTEPDAGHAAVVPATTVAPLDVDGTTAVAVGTVLWGVAGVVLLVFFRDRLADDATMWWLWTCLAGFGLGLLGYVVCARRRDRALRRAGSRLS